MDLNCPVVRLSLTASARRLDDLGVLGAEQVGADDGVGGGVVDGQGVGVMTKLDRLVLGVRRPRDRRQADNTVGG